MWIGGDTPLHYPRIGHLTREIINLGRAVFIEMDGRLLRSRIHEFRPVVAARSVLPLIGLQEPPRFRAGHAANFRATLESIRTAKLSGFHFAWKRPVTSELEIAELRESAGIPYEISMWTAGLKKSHPAFAKRNFSR